MLRLDLNLSELIMLMKLSVYFIIFLLIFQGNVILVDTPGIGANDNLDTILLDFLPQAVSFVFIVDASNAGGIQHDRVMYLHN